VIGGWVVLILGLVVLSRLAGGAVYSNDLSFSGNDSQDARAVLEREFLRAAGDSDQIVFHAASGRLTDPVVRARMQAMFAQVARLPRVVGASA
jgi:RND superfamily putative drug exporter